MNNWHKGLLLSAIFSLFVTALFFGKILRNPGEFYFTTGGDGFKAYYGAIYHLEHDTTAMRLNGMNYPYGEMVFFTGSQPAIVNTVKFVSNHLVDVSGHIVAIMNLLMVFSIVVAAVFLFLIFYELHVSWWYAAIAATGIAILSPQIARFGGHFSLSYLFWIPWMIYLVLRFDKKFSFKQSLVMGGVTFLAGAMQLYFIGFFGFIIGFYWLYRFLNLKRSPMTAGKAVLHLFLQYVLPVVAIQLLIAWNDPVADRTAFPYGFFEYRGHPVAVFFPNGQPYAPARKLLTVFDHIPWESYAFIGAVALAGFFAGTGRFFKKLFSGRQFYAITRNPLVNVLFWSSFAALLLSFGVPFVFGMEGLVEFLGPIRQLRALARFSWFFFYMLNIVVFYQLYRKAFVTSQKKIWKITAGIALVFLFWDGSWNIYLNSRGLQNKMPALEDRSNQHPENAWFDHVNPDEFQAILPIPYFHVGSENIWVESKHNIQEMTMIASLKTGLPTTAVQLSRTSISQTYKNYALVTEPLQPFEVLNDLPNEKPFLLFITKKHNPSPNEKRLIQASTPVYQDEKVELRRLSVETLKNLWKVYAEKVLEAFRDSNLVERNGFKTNAPDAFFVFRDFNEGKLAKSPNSQNAFGYVPGKWVTLSEDTLFEVSGGQRFNVSFWMYNYKLDGYLRANLEITQKELNSDKTTNYIYTDVHRHIKAFYGDWALIELAFETKTASERFKVSIRNNVLKEGTLWIDNFLCYPGGVQIYWKAGDGFFRNGRKFSTANIKKN